MGKRKHPKNKLLILSIILVWFFTIYACSKEKIILLSYQKVEVSSTAEPLDVQLCTAWQLDSIDILKILTESEISSYIEIDVRCSTMPCEYRGDVVLNGKLYTFALNAGGYAILNEKKGNKRNNDPIFLIYDKDNTFFLDTLWRESE